MIISPPFLPATGNLTEEAWLASAMPLPISFNSLDVPEGSYPIGNLMLWHNGIHLSSTSIGAFKTACAVADGELIFVREPTPSNTNKDDPLNYNSTSDHPSWTDTGMVIIQHTTEIGSSDTEATSITYYSVVMHLSTIQHIDVPAVAATKTSKAQAASTRLLNVGDKIRRKDPLGEVGLVEGHRQIHLEICCDETNLKKIIGRDPAWQSPTKAPTAHGRTDAVFGSTYIYVPATAPMDTTEPKSVTRINNPTSTIGKPIWVEIHYQQRSCTLRTYDDVGTLLGQRSDTIHDLTMFDISVDRHNTLTDTAQAQSSPNGWYSLLRFGRNLSGDKLPADAAHWRKINTSATSEAWVDLAYSGCYAFSDADFLPLFGWNCINDDPSPDDQRCDSPQLRKWLADKDDPTGANIKLNTDAKRAKARRLISKFPTEWDKASILNRYGFVKELPGLKDNPESWELFKAHALAVCCDGLPKAYLDAQWHFDPREFIRHFRQCGWLSRSEIVQLIPEKAVRKAKSEWVSEKVPMNLIATELWANRLRELNRSNRQFGINTPRRLAAFFANALQETGWLVVMRENSDSDGNKAAYYFPWDGRGYLQLTWPSNYIKYFRFRGNVISKVDEATLARAHKAARDDLKDKNTKDKLHDTNLKDDKGGSVTIDKEFRDLRDGIVKIPPEDNPTDLALTSGTYWAWSKASQYADITSENVRTTITTDKKESLTYYTHEGFGSVAATVNVGRPVTDYSRINGVQARFQAYSVAQVVLFDTPEFPHSDGKFYPLPEGITLRKST
ncbi:lysozyme family protein [Sapientia aquatica]|uniref:M23 family metallopeptidase n=1 Tax=Sapientia aquatica TaxID=1549640 RepID=A0A4R5VVD4_9BURK|nr:hypothetical protein [Sapientia aquatica]TDK62704.1 hypothetical protein E2I14_15465 [Sapientia aquatica]